MDEQMCIRDRAWAAAVARYRAIDAVRRAARTCLAGGTQELELSLIHI